MSVRRKPKLVEDFIHAAAIDQPGTATMADAKSVQPVKLRLAGDLLDKIDAAVSSRRPSPSRHQWILEAIYEKLGRSDSDN